MMTIHENVTGSKSSFRGNQWPMRFSCQRRYSVTAWYFANVSLEAAA